MSLHDYKKAIALNADPAATFEALIMAALVRRPALQPLRVALPDIAREFTYRYWCSGGIMPGEVGYVEELDDNLPVKP